MASVLLNPVKENLMLEMGRAHRAAFTAKCFLPALHQLLTVERPREARRGPPATHRFAEIQPRLLTL